MEVLNEEYENAGRFFIEENHNTVAEMDYQLPGNNILHIIHTEVSDNLSGKGIGKQLVSAAVDHARKNSLIIKATCSYAKKVLERTLEFKDVYNAEKL